jgi:hypothetical protein
MRLIIKTASDPVAALRLALLAPSPEELQRLLPALADAAGCLSTIQRELSLRPNPSSPSERDERALGRELKALKQDLRAVSKLIEHGAAFWQAWAKLFGAATGGYTPSGEARPVAATGTISVQG